jgi:hypothetical protein
MPYGADMRIMTERMPSDLTAISDAETLAGLAGAIGTGRKHGARRHAGARVAVAAARRL